MISKPESQEDKLDALSAQAELCSTQANGTVKCLACAHGCVIADGGRGLCYVRFNKDGQLYAPDGYAAALACDPVEKKPFFHVLPGAGALSFGMLGCNFICEFCQNYTSSQAFREPMGECGVGRIAPIEIIRAAPSCGAKLVVSTYNEPLITAEWAKKIFTEAKKAGLKCAFVSNGFASPEAVEYIRPVLDACKVDLKCLDDAKYQKIMGGRLAPVLDTIARFKAAGVWIEIVTLVIPGFNDSDEELGAIADFIKSVSPDIPWHVTAFHPEYRMADKPCTPAETLKRAAAIGASRGLNFVYAGNIPVPGMENTRCPKCSALLIERDGYVIKKNLLRTGDCPSCKTAVPGLWK